ncbi:kinase-like domain-containing protein [Mycena olivaceomarginata]|nr:kinase-like domain-containing protein [Mycena olivaceomarginata]
MDDTEDLTADSVPQTQTQEQQQPTPSPEERDPLLWGYLQPYPGNNLWPLERINLRKDNPVVTIGRLEGQDIRIYNGMIIIIFAPTKKLQADDGTKAKSMQRYDGEVEGTILKAGMLRNLKNGAEVSLTLAQAPPPGNTKLKDFRFIYHDLASPLRGVLENYAIEEEIGSGSYSRVYKAYDRKEGNIFAVKAIHAFKSKKSKTWDARGETVDNHQIDGQREIDLMKTLAHPNVCRLRDYFWNADGSIDLVLDYLDGGDLLSFISEKQGLSERMTKHLMRQLCEALAFIHSKNVAHRDLKPENILLTSDRPPVLKIADFGLAKMVSPEAKLESLCGTPMYLAPEFALHMIHGTGYGKELDCFALGAICYHCILVLRPLYSNMLEGAYLIEQVKPDREVDWPTLEQHEFGNDKEGYPIYLSSAGRHIIRGLMESDPKQRLTAAQALQHPWFEFNQADSDGADPQGSQHRLADTSSTQRGGRPGLTLLKNRDRTLERQRDAVDRARRSQTLIEPSRVLIRNVQLSLPTAVAASMQAQAGPSGGNKRRYSTLTPPPTEDAGTPQDARLHQTASLSPEPEPERVMKRAKSVGLDTMDVSPKKIERRRVGR